ncbi:MotA/TolQ/ExbB proton channel family protein [Cereibacter sphaeroides]|uniref:motility protein A n=1 Tax=Rhodobacterales TaxID=204455 RepID=UPI000BBE4E79|nr:MULTISPECIES: MotA/TolQ/ExbB proton channel family protein [Paracoccaceae]MCE6950635.1 MotA/TolQ/ExbB proton channel family protein [Cereibacter sphaeroides]MCE6959138.1 MotA/TolQ/ExbB proton channel family protein [Cereibacter sphaeroides]MCE6968379.1 MotA/TolQ/ExbB proton channel family protein [Cereibacter sphaeroides]MCE6974201.1 MotA/TolQ/ExbB proton channel family protein [Cereibacter sphaeroides]
MEIAAIVGLAGAIVMIIGSMVYAGGVMPFVDIPSVIIVFGGTFFVVLAMKPLPVFFGHFRAMAKVFKPTRFDTDEVISRMVELSNIAKKDGVMALEGKPVPDPFFEKGLQIIVDGGDEAKLVKQMKYEIKAMKARHEAYQGAIKAWVDIGPAMGMVGTLIGLVLMLGNMSDPKSIGPAMAVALLTTLYGALIANVIFGPILNKLEGYSADEVTYRELVIEGLRGIARGESARVIEDQMICALDRKQQLKRKAA